ncbi:tRNA selenocysteine 1-associated protein 1-like isoform X2 [Oratosquilla oratoria]|uniref:tRNA selenocysteine 1-associated protein 1-like isoform X2 n=1 Tax=Oratosquilla oratoria TaxID=337810 RepID=UPI003F764D32
MAREGALWMGDLADYMDENFILGAFRALGEDSVLNVKPIRFKLNHSSTRGSTQDREYSLWVGDLTPDVDDFALYKTFGTRYNTIKTAKVIYDQQGQSKGFAFVRFSSEDEYKDALTHMNGYKGLGQRPLKVSYAVPKKSHYTTMNHMGGGDYNQYYEQYWNNYAAWQNYGSYYDPYSGSYGGYGCVAGVEEEKENNKEEFEPVEWNTPINVDQANKDYLRRSEEFWSAMERSRWDFWDDLKQVAE